MRKREQAQIFLRGWQHLCRCITLALLLMPMAFLRAETLVDLASDTAWTLRCDNGPARPIRVSP